MLKQARNSTKSAENRGPKYANSPLVLQSMVFNAKMHISQQRQASGILRLYAVVCSHLNRQVQEFSEYRIEEK